MTDVAALIADLVRAGVDPDLIGRTAQALAEREPVRVVDEQAERRRAADAERKRQARLRNSADVRGHPSPKKETSPTPPKEKTTPSSSEAVASSPRRELLAVLDADRSKAVVDHRQRIRKPLTTHAAKLLAGKFAQCPDPNAAADAMIANGWQGFEPEWLDRQQPRGSPPERPRSTLDAVNALKARMTDADRSDQDPQPDQPLALGLSRYG